MSSELAIQVRNLGKRYRLGGSRQPSYRSLRESLMNTLAAPLRRGHSGEAPELWALRDVSFDVKQGEVLGIIGRNGAGKSTLLKILSRITEPTTGEADVHGRVGSLLEVGTGFHPELTGRENILLSGTILGMSRKDVQRRFDAIVDFAEVEQFLDTPVKRYSSGMYLRLAFSVAAHLEPDVLLVDEVLAVGDAAFQEKCMGRMGSVAREGRTVLFVSHNLAAVRQICNAGLVLARGQVVHYGTSASAVDAYVSSYSKQTGLIIDHIQHLDANMRLDSVDVNGSEGDRLEVSPGQAVLNIEVTGHLQQPMRVALEAKFSDAYERPLAFFSPGHEAGGAHLYPAGAFKVQGSIRLPRLNRGDYYLSLHLTDPNIIGWADLPFAVRIVSPGSPTSTGFVFDYDRGAGWMLLDTLEPATAPDSPMPPAGHV
jgi:lipopolysaccharide transport system ATP-binding protein